MKIEIGDLVNYYCNDWDVIDNYEPATCIVMEINKLVSTPEDNYDTEFYLYPLDGVETTTGKSYGYFNYIPDYDSSYIEKVS